MNASKFFSELSIVLSREHLDVSSDTGEFLSVEFNGQPLCCVIENGGIRYKPDDIGSVTKDEACDCVVKISKTVYEYISIWKSHLFL